jgi:hypothetical protein
MRVRLPAELEQARSEIEKLKEELRVKEPEWRRWILTGVLITNR